MKKLYNPFSGCHQLILSSVKYRVDPQTRSSAISWIHLALILLWLSLSEKWRGFFHWLLPLKKFRQDLKEWIRTNRTEERLCQSKRRQDPAEEMANIHRGGYELKNLKQQLTGDLQQDGDAANICGEEEYWKLVKIRDGEKGKRDTTSWSDHRDLLHCIQLEPSLTGRKIKFIKTRRNETVKLPKEQRRPVSEETRKAEE